MPVTDTSSGQQIIPRPTGAPWNMREAAKFLGISVRHLHRLIDAGRVRRMRIGRRVLIADAEVRHIAEEGVKDVC